MIHEVLTRTFEPQRRRARAENERGSSPESSKKNNVGFPVIFYLGKVKVSLN